MINIEMKNANVKKNECMNASAGMVVVEAAVIAIAGIILFADTTQRKSTSL